jgi:transcriptional regulator with XRE-family HTH domain
MVRDSSVENPEDHGRAEGSLPPQQEFPASRQLPPAELNPNLWDAFTSWEAPEPEAGQVWRLRWDDTVALAVIDRKGDGRTVSSLPLTEDPQFATDSDLILTPDESPLRSAAMVEVALEMVLHRRVLERCLGQIGKAAWDDLRQLRNAFVHSEPSALPVGRVGPPVTHELDDRLLYRSEQREAHAPLVFAEWYTAPQKEAAGEFVRRRLKELALSPAQLAEASGVPIQAIIELTRGRLPLLGEPDVAKLAEGLSVDPTELQSTLLERLPDELVDALDLPRHKARTYVWAERWEMDEPTARRNMARSVARLSLRAKKMEVADWSRLFEEQFPEEPSGG